MLVNPLYPPLLGDFLKGIGDTPKTPAGGILHLFFRVSHLSSYLLASRTIFSIAGAISFDVSTAKWFRRIRSAVMLIFL